VPARGRPAGSRARQRRTGDTRRAGRAAQVNKDPFGDGWMVKLRLSDPGQVDSLMDPKAYEAKCSSDDH
jgi:hypothetical protein